MSICAFLCELLLYEVTENESKPLSFPELVRFAAVLSLVLLDGSDSGEWIFN